jgi:hypothetical protein
MFYISYKGGDIEGHRISTKTYPIFTRKSRIVDDFYEWQVEQLFIVNKEDSQVVYITNTKIIGL